MLRARASQTAESRLEEARGLALAIGIVVADAFTVPLREPRPGTLFGEGQIQNIAAACEMAEAELVIVDGALSAIRMLPRIVAAVGDRVDVHMDSGIRSGQDVLKAMALGAQGCLLGRAHLYGLAAAGEAGVAKALDILRDELDTTMALCGLADITRASRALLF